MDSPRYNYKIQYLDKRDLFNATGRTGEFDTALPQTWCDLPNDNPIWATNWDEVQAKMGAVWYYSPENNLCGEPLFVSEMLQDIGIQCELEY
jgi:hypothetical protein